MLSLWWLGSAWCAPQGILAARAAAPAESLEQALELATKRNLPVLVLYRAPWCPFSMRVEEDLFDHPAFAPIATDFVRVVVDTNPLASQPWLARYEIRGTPTVQVLDPEGDVLLQIVGDRSVDEWMPVLNAASRLGAIDPETQAVLRAAGHPDALWVGAAHATSAGNPQATIDRWTRLDPRVHAEKIARAHIALAPEGSEARRDALLAFVEAHPSAPDVARHQLALATWYDAQGDAEARDAWLERATSHVRSTLKADAGRIYARSLGEFEAAYSVLADAERLAGSTDKAALTALIVASERHGTDRPSDHAFVGNFHRHAQDFDAAQQHYARLAEQHPDELWYPLMVARMADAGGQRDVAQGHLDAVLAVATGTDRISALELSATFKRDAGDLFGAWNDLGQALGIYDGPLQDGSRLQRRLERIRRTHDELLPAVGPD